MGYVEKTLLPGESVVYRARLHWIVTLRDTLVGSVLAVLGILGLMFAMPTGTPLLAVGGVIAFIAGIGIFFSGMIRRNATEIAVTNRRVLIRTGILRRNTVELLLAKLESVQVSEPLIGRMLGYGTVTVRGTGGTPEVFDRVANPIELRRQVQGQIGGGASLEAQAAG